MPIRLVALVAAGGDEVEVLTPEALRQEFMEMTQELDKMYGDV